MRKNKLLLLLALLMTAATGAMAQSGTPSVKKLTVPDTWTGDMTTFSAADLPSDFAAVGDDVVTTIPAPTATGNVVLIYGFSGGETKYVEYANGVQSATDSRDFPRDQIYGYVDIMGYEGVYYTAAAGTSATYSVKMKDGVKDADKWTISPNPAEEGQTVTLKYTGRLKVKGVKATSEAAPATGNSVDLSTLTGDYVAQNGDVLTGETSSYEVTIAAGATVTLDGVTINGSSYCIKCAGDATIILKDGSTNTLTNTGGDYPALSIGDANTTLTIQGSTGVLNVSSGMYCAGIGGGYSNTNSTCGNIRIEGGVITAKGGYGGAGIGTDVGDATCGDIIITGGTITAKGGGNAAGIGSGASDSGSSAVCGDITIANTVTKVTATAGENAPYSIGKGDGSKATCGTVTIGGTKYWENNAAVNGGDTYLAKSPLTVDPSAPAGSGSDIPNSDPYTPGGDPFSF